MWYLLVVDTLKFNWICFVNVWAGFEIRCDYLNCMKLDIVYGLGILYQCWHTSARVSSHWCTGTEIQGGCSHWQPNKTACYLKKGLVIVNGLVVWIKTFWNFFQLDVLDHDMMYVSVINVCDKNMISPDDSLIILFVINGWMLIFSVKCNWY